MRATWAGQHSVGLPRPGTGALCPRVQSGDRGLAELSWRIWTRRRPRGAVRPLKRSNLDCLL